LAQRNTWPTHAFAAGDAPPWFCASAMRRLYDRKGRADGGRYTDSLLVLYRGELIYEWYAEGFDETTVFPVFSVTKSVLATLVGIAIDEGYIESLNQPVIDFFPEAEIPQNSSKRGMTIDHLITMTSGLDESGDWRQANDTGLAAFLQPQQHPPGRRFAYISITYDLLAAVVTRAVGQNLYDYAQVKLFGPLGISSVQWPTMWNGIYRGAGGISMNTHDMLRLGYLWQNYGRWENAQLLCPNFIAQAPPRSMATGGYGRSFWNDRIFPFFMTDVYEARGWQGQFISVYPRANMVVVRTGWSEPRTIN
jgi:CubicO group peptidase (beta-lactamase class C family)